MLKQSSRFVLPNISTRLLVLALVFVCANVNASVLLIIYFVIFGQIRTVFVTHYEYYIDSAVVSHVHAAYSTACCKAGLTFVNRFTLHCIVLVTVLCAWSHLTVPVLTLT